MLLRIGNNEIEMDPSPRKEQKAKIIIAGMDGEQTPLLCPNRKLKQDHQPLPSEGNGSATPDLEQEVH